MALATNPNAIAATVVKCEAGKIGSSPSGVIDYLDVGIAGRETAAIEYDVIWPSGMQWVRGGKLPGLYGGKTGHGNGGQDGFDVRPMWTTDGAAVIYLYDQKVPIGAYGRGPNTKGQRPVFFADRKQHIKLAMTLNTPGKDDGVIELFVDGASILSIRDVLARSVPTMKFAGCFWCVFYGGADTSYAPTTDQFITVTKVTAQP